MKKRKRRELYSKKVERRIKNHALYCLADFRYRRALQCFSTPKKFSWRKFARICTFQDDDVTLSIYLNDCYKLTITKWDRNNAILREEE